MTTLDLTILSEDELLDLIDYHEELKYEIQRDAMCQVYIDHDELLVADTQKHDVIILAIKAQLTNRKKLTN